MTSSFFRGCFVDCLEGRADLLEVLPPFLKEWRWSGSAGDFVDTWLTVENAPNPEVLTVVAEVRRLGIPCYVASTQERHRAGYLAKEMRLREMFDGLFFSSDLGVCKPNENFFRAIAGRLGRPTGELLFFDDSPENVQAAIAAGWLSEQFTTPAKLRSDIAYHTGLAIEAR